MNKPQIFNHQSFGNLPVIVIDGAEWFGATEAAKALGFSNPHKAVDHHVENDDCTVHTVIDSLGRTQQKKFINESGIYSLIFGAAKQGNNPEIQEKARQFKRWVTSEVLPSIRRTGSYALQPMTTAEMIAAIANQAVEQERRLAAVEKRLDDTAEILALNPTEWRRKTTALLNKIAKQRGGHEEYQNVRNESYDLLEQRANCKLAIRVTNIQKRMALEGATKSKINSVSKLDAIAENSRLTEIYLAIIKEMAIKNGVGVDEEAVIDA